MDIKFCILYSTIIYLLQIVENVSSDAVTDCANVHHIPSSALSSVSASYSNGRCTLKCAIGNALPDSSFIHEGLPCNENSAGICHQGQCVVEQEDALKLCDHIHNVDAEKFSTSHASYSNSKCSLSCVIGHTTLQPEPIHEGQNCPEDTTGICRAGHCIGGQEEALRQCGLKHNLDFHKFANHLATAFTNDQCMLRCVLNGDVWSDNPKYEDSPCPANLNGVCRNGTCMTQSTNTGSTVTQSPGTVTKPSIDQFTETKIKSLNILLESTNPSLNPKERIFLYFYETKESTPKTMASLYENQTRSNVYYPQVISGIPSMLSKTSQMSIDLHDDRDTHRMTEQKEDLYPLFATFYHNNKLAFGEHENFVLKFPIYRYYSPHDKLMDVTLRFTIVFSKD